MTQQNYTHIETILDRSGSMSLCWDSTIEGFNSFLADQKKVGGKCTVTQVQFDNAYEIHYHYTDIADVAYINRETYIPRGSTALLDAIGKSIVRLGAELAAKPEHLRPSKVIVLIQTDGQENASTEFNRAQVFEKVKHQQDKYGWEFIFAGTNQDAIMTAASYGIPTRSAIYYSNTAHGTANVWANVSSNISDARTYGSSVCFTNDARASTIDPNDTSTWASTAVIPAITITTTDSAVVPSTTTDSTT
jgi:hypothetical protein